MFFMDGLRVVVMPLGEMVGTHMPLKFPLPITLFIAGCLGILVTYAEPGEWSGPLLVHRALCGSAVGGDGPTCSPSPAGSPSRVCTAAIASLRPLATLVDKKRAPYLYLALNQEKEMLVLSIGAHHRGRQAGAVWLGLSGWVCEQVLGPRLLAHMGMQTREGVFQASLAEEITRRCALAPPQAWAWARQPCWARCAS